MGAKGDIPKISEFLHPHFIGRQTTLRLGYFRLGMSQKLSIIRPLPFERFESNSKK